LDNQKECHEFFQISIYQMHYLNSYHIHNVKSI